MQQPPQIPQKYSMSQLGELLALTQHLTGEMPERLHVTPDFYTWYVHQLAEMAKAYGFTGNGGRVLFKDVELIKKIPVAKKKIIVPNDNLRK